MFTKINPTFFLHIKDFCCMFAVKLISKMALDFDYELSETFYFGEKLRKKHEIFKNF